MPQIDDLIDKRDQLQRELATINSLLADLKQKKESTFNAWLEAEKAVTEARIRGEVNAAD